MYKITRFKNKKVKAKVCNWFQKISGLMFKSRKTDPLLFEFSRPARRAIHSYFVFFPFTAVWYNKNKIIEIRKVKPFTFHVRPKKPFTKLLEIPLKS